MAESKNKSYVKSTREGRLYIPTEDFFKQKKVKTLLDKLLDSSIYKEIKKEKEKSEFETA